MIVYVTDGREVNKIPGPADLSKYSWGWTVLLTGKHGKNERGTWSIALGDAAVRGCKIEHR